MRDLDTVDSELRLLAAVRRSIREHGGEPSSRQEKSKAALAQRMHASGESASTIATTLNVSRATVYRVLAD